MEGLEYSANSILKSKTVTQYIIKLRITCCFLSSIACIFTLIMFIIYLIKIYKNNYKTRFIKSLVKNNDYFTKFEDPDSSLKIELKTKKFSLGAFCMLILIISNLCWDIQAIVSGIKNEFGFFFISDKNFTDCRDYGFLHNFFELCSLVSSFFVALIYFLATVQTKFCNNNLVKQKITVTIFVFIFPLFFIIIGYYPDAFGPGEFICSLDYLGFSNVSHNFLIIFIFLSWILIIGSLILLIASLIIHSNSIKNIGQPSKEIVNEFKKYIVIFTIFALNLFLPRFLILLVNILKIALSNETIITMSYINNGFFCMNGVFNSILICIFQKNCLFPKKKNKKGNSNGMMKSEDDLGGFNFDDIREDEGFQTDDSGY